MKWVMVISIVTSLAFGLGLLFLPGPMAGMYGVELSPAGQFIARFFGSTLLGWAALNWLALRLPPGLPLLYILFGNFVSDVLNLPVVLVGMLQRVGGINDLGWLLVLFYTFFTVGYGYFTWRLYRALKTA